MYVRVRFCSNRTQLPCFWRLHKFRLIIYMYIVPNNANTKIMFSCQVAGGGPGEYITDRCAPRPAATIPGKTNKYKFVILNKHRDGNLWKRGRRFALDRSASISRIPKMYYCRLVRTMEIYYNKGKSMWFHIWKWRKIKRERMRRAVLLARAETSTGDISSCTERRVSFLGKNLHFGRNSSCPPLTPVNTEKLI